MKGVILENQSATTKMASHLLIVRGNPTIKSMKISIEDPSGIGKGVY